MEGALGFTCILSNPVSTAFDDSLFGSLLYSRAITNIHHRLAIQDYYILVA
jgi:hypothetical protein